MKELQCSPLGNTWLPERTPKTHENMIKTEELKHYRLFIASAGETNAYKFKQIFDERLTNVYQIRIISATVDYTDPGAIGDLPPTLFVSFKNFPSTNFKVSATTTKNFSYHMAIPTESYTNPGVIKKFNYRFPFDYRIFIGRRINIKELDIQVYYQNVTSGDYLLFTDLNYIGIEIELT